MENLEQYHEEKPKNKLSTERVSFNINNEQNNMTGCYSKTFNQTMRENFSQKKKDSHYEKKNESNRESLEFLKKIYKPRKQSKEKLIEIKNNIIKNRFFNKTNEGESENKPEHIKKTNRGVKFRIRTEKNNMNSLNSDGSMTNLSNGEGFITQKKEGIAQDQREKHENENIKQSTTYKLIENKTVERQNKLDHQKYHVLKNNINSKTKTTTDETNASTKFIDDNKEIAENQMKITNQPNSVNISVNLKPTFHLSLNSAMQK